MKDSEPYSYTKSGSKDQIVRAEKSYTRGGNKCDLSDGSKKSKWSYACLAGSSIPRGVHQIRNKGEGREQKK